MSSQNQENQDDLDIIEVDDDEEDEPINNQFMRSHTKHITSEAANESSAPEQVISKQLVQF